MQFEITGQRGKPYVVLLGPALCTRESMRSMAERLSRDCRVLLVTYDGHDQPELLYKGPTDQAVQILNYLKGRGVYRISLIAGIAAGAQTALELVRLLKQDGRIQVKHVLCDGGYFHRMAWPRVGVHMLALKVWLKKARTGTPQEAADTASRSRLFRLFTGCGPHLDASLLNDLIRAARVVSRWSVRRLLRSTLRFSLRELDEQTQRSVVFLWSSGDRAAVSRQEIRNHYPYSLCQVMHFGGHLGFFVRDPGRYEQLLRGLAGVACPAVPDAGETAGCGKSID